MKSSRSGQGDSRWRGWLFGVAAVAALSAIPAGVLGLRGAWAGAEEIQSVCPIGFEDLTLTLKRTDMNVSELNKISPDFANAYRVGNPRVMIKDPDKFRMDSRVGFLHFQYIINGPRSVMHAPLINQTREIGADPGKRQGLLDLGLVTLGSLRGYEVQFQKSEEEGGRPVQCYKLTYTHDPERYELLWVDAERRCLVKRVFYTMMHGELKMSFRYSDPQKVTFTQPTPGEIWLPRRIEVRNAEDRVCGVTVQTDIVVNRGLEDSLFKL